MENEVNNNLYHTFKGVKEVDYTKGTFTGWQMFNENNETNATEMEIRLLLNDLRGKSGIERDEILSDFVSKHKAIIAST